MPDIDWSNPAIIAAIIGAVALIIGAIIAAVAKAHYNLGVDLWRKGDIEGAIAEYRQAIRIKPDDAAAHYNLACACAQKRDARLAVESLRKAIDLDSKYKGMARTDKGFDPIRSDREFKRLLK